MMMTQPLLISQQTTTHKQLMATTLNCRRQKPPKFSPTLILTAAIGWCLATTPTSAQQTPAQKQDTALAPLWARPEQWKALLKKYFPDQVKD